MRAVVGSEPGRLVCPAGRFHHIRHDPNGCHRRGLRRIAVIARLLDPKAPGSCAQRGRSRSASAHLPAPLPARARWRTHRPRHMGWQWRRPRRPARMETSGRWSRRTPRLSSAPPYRAFNAATVARVLRSTEDSSARCQTRTCNTARCSRSTGASGYGTRAAGEVVRRRRWPYRRQGPRRCALQQWPRGLGIAQPTWRAAATTRSSGPCTGQGRASDQGRRGLHRGSIRVGASTAWVALPVGETLVRVPLPR